jgi:hypothetical protein
MLFFENGISFSKFFSFYKKKKKKKKKKKEEKEKKIFVAKYAKTVAF